MFKQRSHSKQLWKRSDF